MDTQLIERYFDGDLSEAAQAEFQHRLENDAAFAEAFQLEKDIMVGLQSFGNQRLRKQLDAIHAEETGGAVIKKMRPARRHLLWAAAAAVAILAVAIFALKNQKPTPAKLYAEYAVHDFSLTVQGSNAGILPQAEQYLNAGKYAEAANLLEPYLTQNPNDTQARMAFGIAKLELGEYDAASLIFEKIRTETPAIKNDATWYLALTYLKQGDFANCKNELKNIPPRSARHKAATALSGQLPD